MEDTELRGQFDAIREQFHGVIVRMERFEVQMDGFEKSLADVRAEFRPRLEGLENRLAGKASTVMVSLQTALIILVMTAYKFFL